MGVVNLIKRVSSGNFIDGENHTLVANFRLVRVSLRCACNGLIMTNMSVLELPPSENCSRYVNYTRSVKPKLMYHGLRNAYLAISIGHVASLLTLSQSANHVSETAQTFVDTLGLNESLSSSYTVTEPFTTSKINEVQRSFASLASDTVLANELQDEN